MKQVRTILAVVVAIGFGTACVDEQERAPPPVEILDAAQAEPAEGTPPAEPEAAAVADADAGADDAGVPAPTAPPDAGGLAPAPAPEAGAAAPAPEPQAEERPAPAPAPQAQAPEAQPAPAAQPAPEPEPEPAPEAAAPPAEAAPTAPTAPTAPAQAVGDQLAQGEALWTKYCRSCHGVDGSKTRMGSMTMQDLTDPAYQQQVSDEALRQVTAEGRGRMPGYAGKLSADELQALVAYMRTLKQS